MLQIKNLSKTFAGHSQPTLSSISLTLQTGDFCMVIGSNGSGKSTLLKILLGEYAADTGKIRLGDQDIFKQPLYQRGKYISGVFQDVVRGTIADMTVSENLSLAYMRGRKATFGSYRQYQHVFMQHLSSLQMDLEKKLNTLCRELSGGQRQAIAFTMATLHSPQLLLLDEHCSALDPKSSQHIMESTAQLIQQKNITTLMVTHHLPDAIKHGNRLIMIHKGNIVFDVSGTEKKALTITQLLQRFHHHEDSLLMGEG